VAGAGSTTAPAATAGGNVQVVTISGASVLANSKGLTLYTFAPDPANKSVCYGSCAQYWPPVKGPLTAPSGVSGTFATIKRTDGTVQATFNGHPLYTYVGDSGKGQAHGNNLNLNGGLWHEVTTSG
jgi:predicted lipoprotein with Yx(FWY)xxD motif